jgi:hypothetical protein
MDQDSLPGGRRMQTTGVIGYGKSRFGQHMLIGTAFVFIVNTELLKTGYWK